VRIPGTIQSLVTRKSRSADNPATTKERPKDCGRIRTWLSRREGPRERRSPIARASVWVRESAAFETPMRAASCAGAFREPEPWTAARFRGSLQSQARSRRNCTGSQRLGAASFAAKRAGEAFRGIFLRSNRPSRGREDAVRKRLPKTGNRLLNARDSVRSIRLPTSILHGGYHAPFPGVCQNLGRATRKAGQPD